MASIRKMGFVWHVKSTVINALPQQVAHYVVARIISHPQINVLHAASKTVHHAILINLVTLVSQAIQAQPALKYARNIVTYVKEVYVMCATMVFISAMDFV